MALSLKALHIKHRFLVILLLVTDRKFSQMHPQGLHELDGELEEEIQHLVLVRVFFLMNENLHKKFRIRYYISFMLYDMY